MLSNFKKALMGYTNRPVWLIAVLLVVVLGMAASARTWLKSTSSTRPAGIENKLAASPALANSPAIQEQAVIRLLTSGFNPTQISGAAGQYRLVATRPSRDEEVVLQLKRESGELVQEIEMPQEKSNWTTLIELEAGSYTLTVANHPQWICHITVQ
jgi:hypothetical protein